MKKILILAFILTSQVSFAQKTGMPKAKWLSNLEKILPAGLCKPQSPLMKIYKGTDCLTDMKAMYRKCTTEVKNVIIPDTITSIPMANHLGQVIAECMAAHYQGGQSLELFNLMQALANKQKRR